ncbi:MAG: transporter permease [Fibrobacteres bacterium]|nr:transporter permease [Fibrobacterota bacterium]
MNAPDPKKKKPSMRTVRKAFATIVWPRRKLLFLGLILIVISRLSGLVLPGSTKYLLDTVVPHRDFRLLGILLAVVGLSVLVQSATSFALTRLLAVEAQHLISRLRLQMQKHIIGLPVGFFDSTKSGVLLSRIMNDPEGVRNLVGTGVVQLVGGILTAVVSLFLLLRISPWLTIASLFPLILFSLISFKAFSRIRPIFRERGKITAEVTGRLTETLGGIRVVKGFHAEDREVKVFESGVDTLFRNVRKSMTTTSVVTSLATLLLGVTSVLIMGIGGRLIFQGEMTVGDFVAFTLYLGFLVAPIVQMSNIGSQLTEAFAGLDRMEEILALEPEGREPERVNDLKRLEGHVAFRNVRFGYETGKEVLKGIDLEAKAGTVTALVGSSGSGKTTLAGLAASFLKPTQGSILVDGVDLATLKLESYRRHLAVVLQDEFLFEGTIRDNILFGRPGAGDAELTDAVRSANLKEFTDGLEKGLDTLIGERGVKLSGGQRQRVAIARALLADPRILFLDEATSNLDAESEMLIQESLAGLMKGRTTFVIAHRLSTIRRADAILVVEAGEIVERGTHDELIAKQGRYFQLFTYQSRI